MTDVEIVRRKRKSKCPLVENEVRRSPRIQLLNNGFKNPCPNNDCLPCNENPPIINTKLVRNLASSFCKVAEEGLEEKLSKKKKKNAGEKGSLAQNKSAASQAPGKGKKPNAGAGKEK